MFCFNKKLHKLFHFHFLLSAATTSEKVKYNLETISRNATELTALGRIEHWVRSSSIGSTVVETKNKSYKVRHLTFSLNFTLIITDTFEIQ